MATQTFCSAGVLALATIMGPVAPGYEELRPPKGAVAPGPVENAASPADRYCAKPAEATAPPECIYSSMKDCSASLKGKAGRCYKF